MAIERNYFLTVHHQAGVNFVNFTEVKFREILLSGTGDRDRLLNRDSPGQTGMYGRSTVSQVARVYERWNFRFSLALKYVLLQSKHMSAWRRNGCGNPGRASFKMGLHFLCHAQLLAELGKPR